MATQAQRFQAYLTALDDDMLGCKADYRHRMPRLKQGRLPDGITVRRVRGGAYEILAACTECGVPGTLVTGRGGQLDGTEHWDYDYSKLPGYLAPRGTGRGRLADYRIELGRRNAPGIRQLAAVQEVARERPGRNGRPRS